MTVISPWSRGGWVNSQVFDHTSVLRFLELVTGVHEPNISAWRRTVCGDLTSCFDFTSFDPGVPRLPDVDKLVGAADAEKKLPKVTAPRHGTQPMPAQEKTARRHRPLPYRPGATLVVPVGRKVKIALTNTGTAAVSYAVFATGVTPFAPTPVLVAQDQVRYYTFDTLATSGRYDLAVHGPNGFLRRFAGRTGPAGEIRAGIAAEPGDRAVRLTLANHSPASARFTLDGPDAPTAHHDLAPGAHATVRWPAEDGAYDVTVTTGDTEHRYAGRLDG